MLIESKAFQEYFRLTIDSLDNYLFIKLAIKNPERIKNFPFPKDKNSNELRQTAINFDFFYDNKRLIGELPNDQMLNTASWRFKTHDPKKSFNKMISFTSDTITINKYTEILFSIPFYVFNKLKKGKQDLELRCSQVIFCSEKKHHNKDSIRNKLLVKRRLKTNLLFCITKFKIQIPIIYKTDIYAYDIKLRNDSVFSPAGMDATLWKSTFPDMYWQINYPKNEFYCNSKAQTSTDYYLGQDTFSVFHYSPSDSIMLSVWDRDDLTPPDFISEKRFSLNQFPENKKVTLKFQNIQKMEIKTVRLGIVNN